MTRRTIELLAFLAALLLAALAFHAWLASHDEQQRLQSTLATQQQLIDAADARERDRNTALSDTLAQIAKLKATAQTPEEILGSLRQYLHLPQPITLQTNPAANVAAAKSARANADGFQATNSESPRGVAPQATSSSPGELSNASTPTISGSTSTQVDASAQRGMQSANVPVGIQSHDTSATRTQQGTHLPQNFPADSHSGVASASLSTDLPKRPSSPATKDTTIPAALIPAADLKPLYDFVQDCRACQAQLAVAKQNSADDAAKLASLTRERDAAITAAKGGTLWRRLRRNAAWLAAGAALGYAAAKR